MTNSETREFIEKLLRAWERQDIDEIVGCYSEDCSVVSPIFKTIQGRTRLRESFETLFRSFSDLSIKINDIVIDREFDQRAAVVCNFQSTNREPILGFPRLGRRTEMAITFLLRFRDGLIASENRVYSLSNLRELLEKTRTELELKVASDVQQALLPRTRHSGHYFEAVGASLTCRAIGGDFFEYVDLPHGSLGLAVGDVSGKGPAAALLASMLQGILSVEANSERSPAETLARTNLALLRRGIDGRFATLVYGVLTPDGRFVYSNAGHNPPILLRAGGVRRLQVGGPILGVFEGAVFEEETLRLEPGDFIVLYTDGVTEAFNAAGDEFGEGRLASVATSREYSPIALLDAVFTAVKEFCNETPQSDDVTLVAMRFR